MRLSYIISFIVHAGILLAAVIVLPEPDKFLVENQESIPVEIIEFSELSQRVASIKNAKEDPVKKPLPPKVEEIDVPKEQAKPEKEIKKAVKEPQPEPAPEPVKEQPTPPEPDPVKELIEKVENQPEPEPKLEPEPEKAKTEAKPVPVPRRKPEIPKTFKTAEKKKKKHKFDPNQLNALLNKIDDDRTAPPKPVDETGTPDNGEITNLLGQDQKLTGNEADWLISRIGQCWSPPIGMKESGAVIPRVQFEMDIEGNIIGTPAVTNFSTNPLFGVAVRSAINAIYSCAPYSQLPQEKYDKWRIIAVNFDPRRMLGIN